MKHPAFQSVPRVVVYAIISLLTGLALYVSEVELLSVAPVILWLDSLVHALVCALLSFFLWYVVQFADLSESLPMQRFLNNAALVLLSLAAWIGIPMLVQHIFWESHIDELNKGIALRVIFGLQLILIQLLALKYLKAGHNEDLEEEDGYPVIPEVSTPIVASAPVDITPAEPMSVHKEPISTISVKTGQKIQMIPISDVLFLQAEGDYVLIQTAEGRHLKEQTMKFFEENLPAESFVRIHRSCIVHTSYISRIELYEKQNYRITLKTGHQLKASQTGYRLLKNTLAL